MGKSWYLVLDCAAMGADYLPRTLLKTTAYKDLKGYFLRKWESAGTLRRSFTKGTLNKQSSTLSKRLEVFTQSAAPYLEKSLSTVHWSISRIRTQLLWR